MDCFLQGQHNVLWLKQWRWSAMVFLMGVILGILILTLLVTDLIQIISYLFHCIHLKQSGWVVLKLRGSQVRLHVYYCSGYDLMVSISPTLSCDALEVVLYRQLECKFFFLSLFQVFSIWASPLQNTWNLPEVSYHSFTKKVSTFAYTGILVHFILGIKVRVQKAGVRLLRLLLGPCVFSKDIQEWKWMNYRKISSSTPMFLVCRKQWFFFFPTYSSVCETV